MRSAVYFFSPPASHVLGRCRKQFAPSKKREKAINRMLARSIDRSIDRPCPVPSPHHPRLITFDPLFHTRARARRRRRQRQRRRRSIGRSIDRSEASVLVWHERLRRFGMAAEQCTKCGAEGYRNINIIKQNKNYVKNGNSGVTTVTEVRRDLQEVDTARDLRRCLY